MKEIAIVTGGTGFVGSHLVDLLIERNYNVKCIVRKSSDLKWLKNKPLEIVDCGLDDPKKLTAVLEGASYIFHVAGVVKSKRKEGYFRGNVDATKTLLEAAARASSSLKKIVVVSSLTVAGPSLNGKPKEEWEIPAPITTYGMSKYQQEEVAKKYMDRLPITICRAPAVYGERDTDVFLFFKTFKKGLMTTIGFDKKEVSLIHARDLVDGFLLAALSEKSSGEIYFITSKKFYNWKEIGEVTSKVMGRKAINISIPHFLVYIIAAISEFLALFSSKATILNVEKAKDITRKYWTCSYQKAEQDLGFVQKIDLESGITRAVRWYEENGWL